MPKPMLCRRALAVLSLLALAPTLSADPLWLSDRRPPRQTTGHEAHAGQDHSASGSYAAPEEEVKVRGARKLLWLRRGDDPRAAPHLEAPAVAPQVHLIDAYGQRREITADERDGLFNVAVELPELGFYNAYLVQERIEGDRRVVEVAKAELLNGTCCRKDVAIEQTRAIRDATLPLELVREHLPDEALMTRIASGDRVEFTVLHYGKPMAGIPVTMITHQGWTKREVSDTGGRVAFTMIRDYFPAWHEFNRREREEFLITAELETSEAGHSGTVRYNTTRYTTTLPGSYRPSSADYRSYAWGLGIVLFVMTFGGTAIYLYRRRRVRPFQEVRFDDTH